MRIGRTIPPAASPIYLHDILNGVSGIFRGGQEIDRFRAELQEYFGVKHVFLVSSGKAALTLTLLALRAMHPERTEVLIPAFCCFSVPSAIIRAGLKIRLCDVDPETLDYNYDDLRKVAAACNCRVHSGSNGASGSNETDTHKTESRVASERPVDRPPDDSHRLLAVVGIHLFGLTSDIERIRTIVSDPSIGIIEDAAQVMGSEKGGRKLGNFGDVGFFSLGRGKAVSAVEGGVIVTNRDDIAERLQDQRKVSVSYRRTEQIGLLLKSLALWMFQQPSFFWIPKSLPFLKVGKTFFDPEFPIRNLSSFQAGLARRWKEKLAAFILSRRQSSDDWEVLRGESRFEISKVNKISRPDYIRYPVKLSDTRKWQRLYQVGERKGLGIMVTYPTAVSKIPQLQAEFNEERFPVAEGLSRTLLTIPVHPLLTDKDRQKISALLSEFLKT